MSKLYKFKLGDTVVCDNPMVVCEEFEGVEGVVVNVIAKHSGEIRYGPDEYSTQTAYSKLDSVRLVREAKDTPAVEINGCGPWIEVEAEAKSDGGPSSYYDFPSTWVTWNDLADYKSTLQWKEHSFHLGNIGKAIMRWGDKGGTTIKYDTHKIIYSGCRVLMMMVGKQGVRDYLQKLLDDPQFIINKDKGE